VRTLAALAGVGQHRRDVGSRHISYLARSPAVSDRPPRHLVIAHAEQLGACAPVSLVGLACDVVTQRLQYGVTLAPRSRCCPKVHSSGSIAREPRRDGAGFNAQQWVTYLRLALWCAVDHLKRAEPDAHGAIAHALAKHP